MFPATSQVKLLIAQLNIILTAVLPTKQEHTILRESFPNKGSYNFVQSKAAHLYPKPPPLWDAPDSCRDDDDVTQCFNFLHKHSAYQMCNN